MGCGLTVEESCPPQRGEQPLRGADGGAVSANIQLSRLHFCSQRLQHGAAGPWGLQHDLSRLGGAGRYLARLDSDPFHDALNGLLDYLDSHRHRPASCRSAFLIRRAPAPL